MPKKYSKKNQAWKKKKTGVYKRPKGAVTSGLLQSKNRYKSHSLLAGTIPKVGNKDLKFYDTFVSTAASNIVAFGLSQTVKQLQPVSEASVIGETPVNGIIQGPSVNQRIGTKIYLKKLLIKALIGFPAVDTSLNTHEPGGTMQGRLMVVLDKQPNQTQAGASDVLADSDVSDITLRMVNYSNTKRFKFLADKIFTVPTQRAAQGTIFPESAARIECEVDLSGITVTYGTGPQGLFGNIVTNNIYVFFGLDHQHAEDSGYPDNFQFDHVESRVYYTG